MALCTYDFHLIHYIHFRFDFKASDIDFVCFCAEIERKIVEYRVMQVCVHHVHAFFFTIIEEVKQMITKLKTMIFMCI